jgi:putative nucleotidyltransferase with HDIG domain
MIYCFFQRNRKISRRLFVHRFSRGPRATAMPQHPHPHKTSASSPHRENEHRIAINEKVESLSTAHAKRGFSRDKVLETLKTDTAIPALSSSVQKLQDLFNDPEVHIEQVTEIIQLDPGLVSKYLRLANSVVFGGKSISNLDEALLRIGMAEIRRVAMAVGVIDQVRRLRVKVDWPMFLLHCTLTARLTERLIAAYRPLTGRAFLAGLLHDIGKLFLEHYFPHEFESVMVRAMERNSGMHEAEQDLIGITHSEISAALCEKWGLHREICRSIRFHHDPGSPFNKDPIDPEFQTLLAVCVCVADAAANLCKANIQGAQDFSQVNLESLPGSELLQAFVPMTDIDLDVAVEYQKAMETLQALDIVGKPEGTPSAGS